MFTSIVGNMISLSKVIAFQLSELILEFSTHYEYANDFNDFLKLEKTVLGVNEVMKKSEAFENLEIRNLKFKHKGSDEYILKNINLSLKKGTSYSLVGLNGAGSVTRFLISA